MKKKPSQKHSHRPQIIKSKRKQLPQGQTNRLVQDSPSCDLARKTSQQLTRWF